MSNSETIEAAEMEGVFLDFENRRKAARERWTHTAAMNDRAIQTAEDMRAEKVNVEQEKVDTSEQEKADRAEILEDIRLSKAREESEQKEALRSKLKELIAQFAACKCEDEE